MANSENSSATQTSKIKGFRYTRDFVMINFSDGKSAILGTKDSETITLALALKGETVEYRIVDTIKGEYGDYDKVVIDNIG